MTRSRSPRRTLVLSLLLVAIGLSTLSPAAAATDPMKMVPKDSLYCVRINNLEGALGQVDLFLTGLFPMGVSMPVKAQLGQLLGSAELKGLDLKGGFTLFGPLPGPGPDPSRLGLLVPISNYQQFTSNLNVSAPDASGFSTIGDAGGPPIVALQVGDYALLSISEHKQAMTEMKQSLASAGSGLAASLDADEVKRAASVPVWAYANVQLAGQLFGPMVQAKIQEVKQGMEAMQGQAGGSQAAAAMDMYTAVLDTLMKETKFISLSLEPSATSIRAAVVLASAPGTSMAEMLKGNGAKAENKLLGYLQDGAVMNFTGSMDTPFWRKVNEAYIDLLPKLLGGATSSEDIQKLKKMVVDSTDALGGPIAGSFSADMGHKPPFTVKYVAGLKDPAKFSKVLDEAFAMMNDGPIADFYKNMGMNVTLESKRNAATYKGVPIDAVKFGIAVADTNSQQAQMINAMYGDGLDVRLAAVDGLLVYALGQEPQPTVQGLIDQVKAGGTKSAPSEVQAAMGLIPGAEKADFFMTFNILRMVQMMSAIAPIPVPQTQLATQSNIATAGNVANGKITVELAVPKQHVLEAMGFFMQMQQQRMQ